MSNRQIISVHYCGSDWIVAVDDWYRVVEFKHGSVWHSARKVFYSEFLDELQLALDAMPINTED